MRIDRVDLYHVAMPLISPWRTAYGEDAVVGSVLVKLTSGDLAGWGETSPLAAPCYSPEWAGGVFATLRKWLERHCPSRTHPVSPPMSPRAPRPSSASRRSGNPCSSSMP